MKKPTPQADLTEQEKSKPYAKYFYKKLAPVSTDVMKDIEAGPIDPGDALPIEKVNDLLKPGFHAKETGYCFMPDGSGYVAVLTRMPGVNRAMLHWWFRWHMAENLRYKIWYPGSHLGVSVKNRDQLENDSLSDQERFLNNPCYPVEDVGVGTDTLSITFIPPEDFGFDTTRFEDARVATAICSRVGSVTKRAHHTDMCHFVRTTESGVEMRSRFWLGRNLKVNLFSERSLVNRIANTKLVRRLVIPRDAPHQMALHCAQEYSNLAEILPELFHEYSGYHDAA